MTRTERATSPRAIIKDRSESKSGYDKSLRKGGGGAHNWGSVRDEYDLERDALEDNDFEDEELKPTETPNSSESTGNSAAPTEEEIAKAREFRAKALKDGNVDLAAIARTSAAVSTSPPKDTTTRTLG